MHATERFVGITVMSPFFQTEGVDAVLANIVDRAGATAVACNTSVTAPANEGEGVWAPPEDAGASVRLFDRPLWGKRALWLRHGPGHRPRRQYFTDCPYQPRQPNDLTDSAGAIIGQFIDAAKQRGLKVYIQTAAAQPPDMQEQDLPRLPDGRVPANRMAPTASLASGANRQYSRAWVRDVFDQYPNIDGVRPDWPEYPCYKLDEVFQDFGPHAGAWAQANGFNFDVMRADAQRCYDYLHGSLTNDDLTDLADPDWQKSAIQRTADQYPGVVEWLGLKAALSADLLADFRQAITEYGGANKELAANAFAPPFARLTGFDFAAAARCCQSIAPKLYTMHWSLMVKFWADMLMQHNSLLDETLLVRALVNVLDLADSDQAGRRIEDYGYPRPDQPHPIPVAPQRRKIEQVVSDADGRAKIYPLVHGYGPPDDFRRRLQLAVDGPADGVWINRYGYLSDEKLDVIGAVTGQR